MLGDLAAAGVAAGAVLLYSQFWGGLPWRAWSFRWTAKDTTFAVAASAVWLLFVAGQAALLSRIGVMPTLRVLMPAGAALFVGIIGEFGALHEEIASRGYAFPLLVRRVGVGWALVGSAAFFTLGHVIFKGVGFLLLGHFFQGILLAYIFLKSGSLLVPIVLHAAGNLASDMFFSGANDKGVSLNIAAYQFAVKQMGTGSRDLWEVAADIVLMVLLGAATYWWYGRGTRFLEPADILKTKWAAADGADEVVTPTPELVPV
jgi:membrane protease YdiL (CAAX protease family)